MDAIPLLQVKTYEQNLYEKMDTSYMSLSEQILSVKKLTDEIEEEIKKLCRQVEEEIKN